MNFDEDTEDLLATFDDEPELSDPKYRFKERVNRLVKQHNRTLKEAEEIVTTVIRTKEQ
jgi:hypothetical protein